MATINRRLNLVLLLETPKGELQVHHEPIDRLTYEAHFLLITLTMTRYYQRNIPPLTAARSAHLMMKEVAKDEDRLKDFEENLMPEIIRRTNVLVPTNGVIMPMPLQTALNNGTITDDDRAEVLNHVCFFTAASWGHKPDELDAVIYPLLNASGLRTTSLNCTELITSLMTSTQTGDTGKKETPSSIAY